MSSKMAGVDIAALSGLRVEGDAHRAGEAGAFLSVSAGDWHSCGLRADRSVACWGVVTGHPGRGPSQNTAIIVGGPARPEVPRGSFASISAGAMHSCGLKTDGSLACWGNYQPGEGGTPSDSFTYVSAGDQYMRGADRRLGGVLEADLELLGVGTAVRRLLHLRRHGPPGCLRGEGGRLDHVLGQPGDRLCRDPGRPVRFRRRPE